MRTAESPPKLPSHAEVVVVGGGVIGASVAYHLAKFHGADVLLLERSGLTHGCTWHAAGLVGQLRGTSNLTAVMQHSVELYRSLEAETGQATEWKEVGSLRVAASEERWLEVQRLATQARSQGFDLDLVSPEQARDLCPILDVAGLHGAAWIPSDGSVEPSSLTQALARGARMHGARIVEGVEVSEVTVDGRRATAVTTACGASIACDKVVNCGGLWARHVGGLMGEPLPTTTVQHQYLVTAPIPDLPPNLPTLRDPDAGVYYKPEVAGLVMGGWEPNTVRVDVPLDFGTELYTEDFDRFEQHAEAAGARTPVLRGAGIKQLVNGPIPVSADGEPVLGRLPHLDNGYVCAGFTAGVGAAGGAGKVMGDWIMEGDPGLDLWALDVRRFGPTHATNAFLDLRSIEVYGGYYKMHPPGKESESARGARRSPLHAALAAKGAVFGSKFGHERPNWFDTSSAASSPPMEEQPRYERPNWAGAVAAEHAACRERAVLIDQSSFRKLEVEGQGALAGLNRLAAANMDVPVGTVVYTQMCNARGGIEADVTVARLATDRFYVVTGSGFGVHNFGWIERALREQDGGATEATTPTTITKDVSAAFAVINLSGPRARDVLAACAGGGEAAVGGDALPFMGYRTMSVGLATDVRVLRVTFVGELGYELHIPAEAAVPVYEALWEAGQAHGIANAGYRVLDGLRLEKGYRVWGSDVTSDTTPFEAGLGFAVDFGEGSGDFVGRDALAAAKAAGPPARRLATFTADDGGLQMYGGEAILHRGQVVGVTTSGAMCHTIQKRVVLGYVPAELALDKTEGAWSIEAFGRAVPATKQSPLNRSLYDPAREKILA